MKPFSRCGSRFLLSKRKVLFAASYTGSIIHLQYFYETIEKFTSSGKQFVIMGDFNIDLLKCDSSSYSQEFMSSLQSCYLIPTIDKPTRVRSSSATLIDNIFINNPDQVVTCGNVVSDTTEIT